MSLRPILKPSFWALLLVVVTILADTSWAGAHNVRIGVLAKRGLDHCRTQWQPTAEYLTDKVTPHRFEIVPLDFASVPKAVADKKIAFILTNSSSYVELEDQFGVHGIATLINRMPCGDQKLFGGVIFTRENRHDIKALRELQLVPYDPFARQTLSAIYDHYRSWFILGGILLIAVCMGAVWVAKLNARLSATNDNLIREIKKRKQIETGLLESETRLQYILDRSIAGILIIEPETHTIVDANQSALDMIGADKNSVVGRKCDQFIDLSREGGGPVTDPKQALNQTEFPLIRADGSQKEILKTVTSFKMQGQSYLLNSFIDISELKETQLNLESALVTANAANRSKDEFLANMSHELRTPLNGIIGMTGILQNSELTDEQSEFAEIIMRSSEGLLTVITDILDYSQIAVGKFSLDEAAFDLFSMINDLVGDIAPEAEQKKLIFSHQVDGDVPAYLCGDTRRIKKVLGNILDNAVKFTPTGTVSLHVAMAEDDEKECSLRFLVTDTGIGISPERKELIFDPFSQVDHTSTRRYGGTGLGLALAKYFTEMMGGHIGFESIPDQGSKFWFTVRLSKETSVPIPYPYPMDDISGKRILVVDDNQTNCHVLRGYLKAWQLRYTTVGNALEALAVMHEAVSDNDPYDLAVIDHMMPEMDGLDLGRTIKQNPRLKDIRMILFTSIGYGCDKEDIQQAGFDALLPKPIRSSQLYNCLKMVNSNTTMRQCDPAAPERLITHEIVKETQAACGPRILVVEDNMINQRVMLKILSHRGCRTEVAENGRLAVQALCQKAFDVVLMDLQMPEMNGFEATTAIRNPANHCLNPQVPIIAVTANTLRGDRQKCLEAGMDDYLPKPVNPSALMDKINQWYQKRYQQKPPDPGPRSKMAN